MIAFFVSFHMNVVYKYKSETNSFFALHQYKQWNNFRIL